MAKHPPKPKPCDDELEHITLALLHELFKQMHAEANKRHKEIMTALETLTSSVDSLTASNTDLTAAVNDAITRIGTPSATDAQLLSIAGIVDHNTEVVKAQTAALQAALNPPPPPPTV